jgi:hypothetical protein
MSESLEFSHFSCTLILAFGATELMQGTSQAEEVYKPGDEVPESGVYSIRHYLHRENHSATIFKGERFPRCAHCGNAVRFVLVRRAGRIIEDADFNHETRNQ